MHHTTYTYRYSKGFTQHHFSKKSGAGFTLIELILYVGLMAILMLSIARFLPILLESRVKSQTIAEVEQQGLHVMQIMTEAIRNADGIAAPDPGDTNDALDLVGPAASTMRFDLSGEAIEMIEGMDDGVPLTNDRVSASNIVVKNLSKPGTPGFIHIEFTITYRNWSGTTPYDYSKTFYGGAALRPPHL